MTLFRDRQEAGRRLASELLRFKKQRPVVLGLPRGGVPVGYEIAEALGAPLDVILVRKIGAPDSPELAIGAVIDGSHPEALLDEELVSNFSIPQAYIDREIAVQAREIERRRALYLKGRALAQLAGSTAVIVDDGLATGATMRIALRAVKRRGPSKLVMAVPVAPARAIESLRPDVDEIVCLAVPDEFYAIGQFYVDFHQVSDDEVVALLDRAAKFPK